MKSKRHAMILQLIQGSPIETQDELVNGLFANGFDVTQATVSRDIKELRLVKSANTDGHYYYVQMEQQNEETLSQRFIEIFARCVTQISGAGNLVVIKTLTGSASAAAEAIDNLHWPEILGSIAGDNTIFIAINDAHDVEPFIQRLHGIIEQGKYS